MNNKLGYKVEVMDRPAKDVLDGEVSAWIEGYAAALADVMSKVSGDSPCSKSYDPLKVEGEVLFSYAFDLKDGTRRHPVSDYGTIREICELMVKESMDWIKDD